MKKTIFTLTFLSLWGGSFAQAPSFATGQQYAPKSGQASLQIIKTDANNNVYIYGASNDTLDVDLGTTTTLVGLNGDYSYQDYFQKQDANGNVLWTVVGLTAANVYEQYISDFSVDNSGNIYLVGENYGAVHSSFDADPGAGVSTINALGSNWDIFLIKLNNSGTHVWSTIFGLSNADDYGASVEADSQGNAIVAFTGVNPSSSSYEYGSILKISSSGSLIFQKSIQGAGKCNITDIAIDGSNNIISGGYYMHDIDFDPGSGTALLSTDFSKRNKFILKLNSSGVYQWVNDVRCQASASGYQVRNLTCDSNGNIYQTGIQNTFTVNYGPNSTFPLTNSNTGRVPFVHKVSASGQHVWAKLATVTPYDNYIVDIAVLASDDVAVASDILSNQTNISIFSELDGTELFNDTIFNMGTTSALYPLLPKTILTVSNDGSIYLTGNSNQTIKPDFSNNTFEYTNINGSSNAFLLKYQTCSLDNGVTTSGITLTATQNGASYQWIDCNNGNAPINGAINQSFTPNVNGNYAVIVENGSCSTTSACTSITTVGLEEWEENTSIYPNPATSQLMVNAKTNDLILIYDQLGTLVKHIRMPSDNTIVELTDLANGVYTVRLNKQNGQFSTHKLIKQ